MRITTQSATTHTIYREAGKVEVEPEVNVFLEETREIVKTYCKWGERLLAQDYEGAMALVIPGLNGEGATNVAKAAWDRGNQHYFNFTYVEHDVSEDELSKNQGRALGNYEFIQSGNGYHYVYDLGFYSSCRNISGQWRIEGFNSNLDVDWFGIHYNDEWPDICGR